MAKIISQVLITVKFVTEITLDLQDQCSSKEKAETKDFAQMLSLLQQERWQIIKKLDSVF